MAWYIINDNEAVPIRNGTIVGRDDFENAGVLSRQHFKFIVKRGKLSVRDLGSRNGTLLRGEPLGGEEPAALVNNDLLQVGDTDFYISWRRPSARIAWSIFALLILFKVLDPTTGFGRAMGGLGWLYIGLSAGLATWITGFVLGRLIPVRFVWPYVAAAVVLATALDLGQLLLIARRLHLAEYAVRERVEFFCETHFKARQCVKQVASCPWCVIPMARWRRHKIADHLEAVRVAQPERSLSSTPGKH